MSLDTFENTPAGRKVSSLLADPSIVLAMEDFARRGVPAVAAIDAKLPRDTKLSDTEKQYVGRLIKAALGERGWQPWVQRRFNGGAVFSSGTVYRREPAPHSGPVAGTEIADRIRAVQAAVRALGPSDYGVDAFLRDKHAEAAAERY